MEKGRWLEFLSSKLKSQISRENARKAQTWGFALLSLLALGAALQSIGTSERETFVFGVKVLFLFLAHVVFVLGFYLPGRLQKGEKPLANSLQVRDFTSLAAIFLGITFYTVVTLVLSWQVIGSVNFPRLSGFFSFIAWTNFLFFLTYAAFQTFSLFSFLFSPNALIRFIERSAKAIPTLLGIHAVSILLWMMAYSELNPVGSPAFFDQLRAAGLFWIFVSSSILFISRLLEESSVPSLVALEFDVVSGKLEQNEEILARLKTTFASRRLSSWLNHLSHVIAAQAHQIVQSTHEAVSFAMREKPTEVDLRQVEERYRKAERTYKKLEKESLRFLFQVSLFELAEAEREKVETVREQFSRELRNAKLELASVRKRIDETLVAFRNTQISSLMTSAASIDKPLDKPAEKPQEKIPTTATRS